MRQRGVRRGYAATASPLPFFEGSDFDPAESDDLLPSLEPELESEEAFESPSEEEVPESLVLALSRWRRRVP